MRAEVVEAVRALSDPEYQQRVWVRRELPHPEYYDELSHNIHVLYDDTPVFDDPSSTIGQILRGEAEAQALRALKASLEALFDVHGTGLSDERYLSLAGWAGVIESARHALEVLTRDDAGGDA
nr:hypothetical protein [Saccharothrix australiensis]